MKSIKDRHWLFANWKCKSQIKCKY